MSTSSRIGVSDLGRERIPLPAEGDLKRPIIVDALNVMYEGMYSGGDGHEKTLDCLTILPVMRYFVRRGHTVRIVIPSFCLDDHNSGRFSNNRFLRELEKHVGYVTRVMNKSNDDLIALVIARDTFGSVVSKDKFRDHRYLFPLLSEVSARNIFITYFAGDGSKYLEYDGDKFYLSPFVVQILRKDQLYCSLGTTGYAAVKSEQLRDEEVERIVQKIDVLLAIAEAYDVIYSGGILRKEHMFAKWNRLPRTIDDYDRLSIEMTYSPMVQLPDLLGGPFMSNEEARRIVEERKKAASQSRSTGND
uniref:RNase NYN domain-containing protein n=1 Tax=Parascaris univalens TaxID=6257 RepID=A0A915B228_PARUN